MEYILKAEIDGREVLQTQNDETDDNATRILGAQYLNNASNGKMEIGATASDSLLLSLSNPWKPTFDGSVVKLFVAPIDGDEEEESLTAVIEDEVGDSTEYEMTDDEESMIESDEEDEDEEDEAEAEDLSEDDEAELTASESADLSAQFEALAGDDATEDEDDAEEPDSDDVDPNTDEDVPDWHQLGVFYVTGQTTSADGESVTLKAYDGFILMNDTFTPTTTEASPQAHYEDLRAQLGERGIVVDDYDWPVEMEEMVINWNKVTSFRQAIGYLAGLVGCFAEFGEDGSVGFSYYTATDIVLIDSELMQYNGTSAGEMVIGEILCNDENGNPMLESGGGQSITMTNPFMTQDLLDNVLSVYGGLRMSGASIVAPWTEAIRSGQFIRVMSEDEYKSYVAVRNAITATEEAGAEVDEEMMDDLNSLGKIVLVTSQTVTFGGEATTSISATSATEFDKANVIQTLIGQRVTDSLNAAEEASKVATNYLSYTEEGGLFVSENAENVNEGTAANITADAFRIMNNGKTASEFKGDGIGFYDVNNDQLLFKMDASGDNNGGRLVSGDNNSYIELFEDAISLKSDSIYCNKKYLGPVRTSARPASSITPSPSWKFSLYVDDSKSSCTITAFPYLGFAILRGYFVLAKAVSKETSVTLVAPANGFSGGVESSYNKQALFKPINNSALALYRANASAAKAVINSSLELKMYNEADWAVGASFYISGVYLIS